MDLKKIKSGNNKNRIRTIYHFTDSCQEKGVNSQKLFIYPSFSKFWGFFHTLILSFCQSTKLLAEIVIFSYSRWEETKILMKSYNFQKLNVEIYRKLQNFLKFCDIESIFGQNMCPTMWDILINSYTFYFMKKSCQVLKLCHLKVQCLDFSMKIGLLKKGFWIAAKSFFFFLKKKETSHTLGSKCHM